MNRSNVIRVAFAHYPPQSIRCGTKRLPTTVPTTECPTPGWCVEILYYLAEALNLTVEPVVVEGEIGQEQVGKKINGTYDGWLGYVANGTADTLCMLFQSTTEREEDFSLTIPVYYMKPDFLVRKRRSLTDGINYLASTLNANLWITMAVTFCLMTLVAILCKAAKRERSGVPFSPFQITWQVLQIQLRQSKPICPNSTAAKIALVLFSLLQCGLILSLFEATLVSQLLLGQAITPKTDEDIIRLIGSRRLTFITESMESRYFRELRASPERHFELMRRAIENNPLRHVNGSDEAIERVLGTDSVLFVQEDWPTAWKARGRCDLAYVHGGLPLKATHFMFAKNSPFVGRFNEAIAKHTSFIERTYRKYFEVQQRHCPSDSAGIGRVASSGPLTIESTSGLFVIVFAGLSLGLFAFALEQFFGLWRVLVADKKMSSPMVHTHAKKRSHCKLCRLNNKKFRLEVRRHARRHKGAKSVVFRGIRA